MLDVFENINLISSTTIAVFTVFSAIIVSVYKIFNFLYKIFILEITQRKKLNDNIEYILKEFTPNHGTSLKDKIDKIEVGLSENTKITETNTEILRIITDRQKWLVDKQNIPIFETDAEGNWTWINDAFTNLVNTSRDELLDKKWISFIHESDRNRVTNEWENAVKNNRNSQISFIIVSIDGNKYNVEWYATKHKNNGYTGSLKLK